MQCFNQIKSPALYVCFHVSKLTAVESLEARVISRFPFMPNTAGSRMKICVFSWNTSQLCHESTRNTSQRLLNSFIQLPDAWQNQEIISGSEPLLYPPWLSLGSSPEPHRAESQQRRFPVRPAGMESVSAAPWNRLSQQVHHVDPLLLWIL